MSTFEFDSERGEFPSEGKKFDGILSMSFWFPSFSGEDGCDVGLDMDHGNRDARKRAESLWGGQGSVP